MLYGDFKIFNSYKSRAQLSWSSVSLKLCKGRDISSTMRVSGLIKAVLYRRERETGEGDTPETGSWRRLREDWRRLRSKNATGFSSYLRKYLPNEKTLPEKACLAGNEELKKEEAQNEVFCWVDISFEEDHGMETESLSTFSQQTSDLPSKRLKSTNTTPTLTDLR